MVDVTSTPSAAPSSAAPASAAPTSTVGQSIDAEIVVLKGRLAKLEASAKTDWADIKQWVKTNWPHFATWGALAASSPVVTDFVKKLL
jgi:hypothetical protein